MGITSLLVVELAACGGRVETKPQSTITPDALCSNAAPFEPTTVVDSPIGTFAVSPSGFYWGQRDSFGWQPLEKGSPVVEATDRFNIDSAVADDQGAYFSSLGYPTPSGQITRLLSGGKLEVLGNGFINPAAIAVDEHDVYFVDSGIPSTSDSAGKIWRLSKSGGSRHSFVEGLSYPKEIATSGSYVYWVDVGHAAIQRADKATGTVETLFHTMDGVTDFALVDGAVYWVNERSVNRLELDTGESRPLTVSLFDREGVSDWPEVAANKNAVFVSSAMPDDPSRLGLYMLSPEVDSGFTLTELARDIGVELLVTRKALFYTRVGQDGANQLAMICLPEAPAM